MASSNPSDLAGEVAYVKAMAEEGRNAPLVGGVFYVIWGGVIATTSLLGYAAASGALPFSLFGSASVWIGAFLVGWVASFALGRRAGAKPGSLTIGNKTAAAAWKAVGLFMSIFWISALLLQSHLKTVGIEARVLFGLMFPIAFGIYGIAFFATAAAARLDWMRGFAIASWVFSIAAFYFIGDTKQYLVGAAGSLFCAALPGLLLMRREPSDIV